MLTITYTGSFEGFAEEMTKLGFARGCLSMPPAPIPGLRPYTSPETGPVAPIRPETGPIVPAEPTPAEPTPAEPALAEPAQAPRRRGRPSKVEAALSILRNTAQDNEPVEPNELDEVEEAEIVADEPSEPEALDLAAVKKILLDEMVKPGRDELPNKLMAALGVKKLSELDPSRYQEAVNFARNWGE